MLKSLRDATRQLANRVHLLRLMQLLFKTTPLRHIAGADNDAAKRAKLPGRRRDNSLNHGIALGSLVSVGRSRLKARSKMGLDFQRVFGAQDPLSILWPWITSLSGLSRKAAEVAGLTSAYREEPIAFFHDDGIWHSEEWLKEMSG